MGRAPVPTATVALIAAGFIERGVTFGRLDAASFSDYKIPGTSTTYRQRTLRDAAREAWELIQAVEETRPDE